MHGCDVVIMTGPVHKADEYETAPCDVEKLVLKPGQSATSGAAFKEILSYTGLWQWKLEWDILPNR